MFDLRCALNEIDGVVFEDFNELKQRLSIIIRSNRVNLPADFSAGDLLELVRLQGWWFEDGSRFSIRMH